MFVKAITKNICRLNTFNKGVRTFSFKYNNAVTKTISTSSLININNINHADVTLGNTRRRFNTNANAQLGMWHGPASTLNMNKALNVTETINMYLEESNAALRLEEIRLNSPPRPLSERWQGMLDVFFGVSLHVIVPFGFSGDQMGLQNYTTQIGQVLAGLQNSTNESDKKDLTEFKELSDETWKILLLTAFGIELENHVVSIDQIRNITMAVSSKMQHSDFMNEVESKVKSLPMEQKQQALMGLLIPLQQSVTEEHGMEGEDGYIIYQAQLMKNMTDPQIQHNMAAAMNAVIRNAGISL
jgi:hypothetical protein